MRTIKKDLKLLQKITLLGAAFAVAFGMHGCSSDDAPAETFTPFERIATLDVVSTGGVVDYAATYAKTKAVAAAIHTYIETVTDSNAVDDPVSPGHGFPANWIVGGSDDLDPTVVDAILDIPSPDFIIPDDDTSGTYKVQVMDICNSYYAKMALGVTNVVDGDDTSKVADGFIHAPTLPCEVTVYNDGDNVYVDMLNPEAIFSLFFSDVVFGTQMNDTTFADAMMQLPADVKSELKTIVYAALDDAAYTYTALSEKIGPAYTQDEILSVVDESPYDSPYLHYSYMKSGGAEFTAAEVKSVAAAIIATMGADGTHVADLDAILSTGSSWRSGRVNPLGLPGAGSDDTLAPYKNFVIEACSPKYAKDALGTGRHHAPALPCEITVTAIESAAGSGVYDTLVISFLEPGFMFNVLFSDSFEAMDAVELEYYQDLPSTVLSDLQKIVDYSVDNDMPMTLIRSGQMTYNMLP